MRKAICATLLIVAVHAAAQSPTPAAPSAYGALNATSFPGGDIGARINAAIAKLPKGCGEVVIPAGNYTQTTTILKPRCIKLHGESAFGTTLNWTPKAGTAIVSEDTSGVNDYPEGEVADLTLKGPGFASSTIGFYLGGDPTGSTVAIYVNGAATGTRIPAAGYADHQNLNRARIIDFGTGVQWGNNAFDTTLLEDLIGNDGTGLSYPSGLDNSGESISVIRTSTQADQKALDLVGFSDFYFYGSSCDYNVTCGNVNHADFYGEHFEQASGTILTITGTSQPIVAIFGGWASYTGKGGTDAQMFYVNSNLNPVLKLDSILLTSSHPVAHVVNWNGGGGGGELVIRDLPYYFSGGQIASLSNVPCNFWGCRIEDGQGSLAFSGKHASLLENGAASFQSMTLADSSTALSRYAKYTATLSPAAVGANTCSAQDVPVKGVQPADVVLKAMKPAEQPGLALMGGRATAAGTVAIQFCNNTGAGITPTANEIYTFVVVQ